MTKVLVVEDEPDIRELLVDILEDAGHEVVVAEDGVTALREAHNHHPEIILLDVMMPVMDGLEVLEHLKSDPVTRSITVIMVTAKGQSQDEIKARFAGAWDYITKPFEANEVETKVTAAGLLRRGAPPMKGPPVAAPFKRPPQNW